MAGLRVGESCDPLLVARRALECEIAWSSIDDIVSVERLEAARAEAAANVAQLADAQVYSMLLRG